MSHLMRRLVAAIALVVLSDTSHAAIVINPYIVYPAPTGSGTATLAVLAPADASSTSMTGWHLYKRLSGATTWTLVTTVSGTADLNYTYTGLPTGTWEFKACPYNTNGDSPDGAVLSKAV